MIDIKSCGSHWAGEDQNTIEDLIDMLSKHPLDRTFEDYGNFADSSPEWVNDNPYPGINVTSFFGNFLTVSFVFRIFTDDQPLIERLTAAIRANQKRPDYLSQKIVRKRQNPDSFPGKIEEAA